MLSLPDRLRPVYDGMLRAVGLCAALTDCLRGMLPTEARIALMLKDIVVRSTPSSNPAWVSTETVCAA